MFVLVSQVGYVKTMISDLLMNRIDLSLLVVTKGLTQNAEDYDNKQVRSCPLCAL